MYKHSKVFIVRDCGVRVEAIAPVIISASRSTDVPAFHIDWFLHRLQKGYCAWKNPFNQKFYFVSFENTRCIVFWSKNPKPLLDKIDKIRESGINSYVQFTLNNYVGENIEPGIPSLDIRIDTFKGLVDKLGLGAVVWRYDPVLLTSSMTLERHIENIALIGERLKGYCKKLVFSFADVTCYKKVQYNLGRENIKYTNFDESLMESFAAKLCELGNSLGLELATCGEQISLSKYNIGKNRCIDPVLMSQLFRNDEKLMNWLGYSDMFGTPDIFPKDPAQRLACGCILSKDIGSYNTCGHGCVYCYANVTPDYGKEGAEKARENAHRESIVE